VTAIATTTVLLFFVYICLSVLHFSLNLSKYLKKSVLKNVFGNEIVMSCSLGYQSSVWLYWLDMK